MIKLKRAVEIALKEAEAHQAKLQQTCWRSADGWFFDFDMKPSDVVWVKSDGSIEVIPPKTPDEILADPEPEGSEIDITEYLKTA